MKVGTVVYIHQICCHNELGKWPMSRHNELQDRAWTGVSGDDFGNLCLILFKLDYNRVAGTFFKRYRSCLLSEIYCGAL
jgi:hypothetical protein